MLWSVSVLYLANMFYVQERKQVCVYIYILFFNFFLWRVVFHALMEGFGEARLTLAWY